MRNAEFLVSEARRLDAEEEELRHPESAKDLAHEFG